MTITIHLICFSSSNQCLLLMLFERRKKIYNTTLNTNKTLEWIFFLHYLLNEYKLPECFVDFLLRCCSNAIIRSGQSNFSSISHEGPHSIRYSTWNKSNTNIKIKMWHILNYSIHTFPLRTRRSSTFSTVKSDSSSDFDIFSICFGIFFFSIFT